MKRTALLMTLPFALAIASTTSVALDSKSYTYGDAAIANAISASAQGGLAFAVDQYHNFVTTQLVDRPGVPTLLTESDIEKLINKVNSSPLAAYGLGTNGGARIEIEYDAAQRERMIGVKNGNAIISEYKSKSPGVPKEATQYGLTQTPGGVAADDGAVKSAASNTPEFVKESWNVRTMGSTDNIKAQLLELKSSGATVRSLTFKGFIPRAGGIVAGTLQLALVGGMGSNAMQAMGYAFEATSLGNHEWVARRCGTGDRFSRQERVAKEECETAGLVEAYLDSAEYIFYKFIPDHK